MPILEDASTPAASNPATVTSGVATSNSFSPPANSLVVVVVSWLLSTNASATLTCKDSSNTAYTSFVAKQDTNLASINQIFWLYYNSAPGSITVTITCSDTGDAAAAIIAPRVLTGANSSQAGAGVASAAPAGATTAWTSSLTTTQTGSQVYVAAGSPASSSTTLTAAANTTVIAQEFNSTEGDTGGTGKGTSTTGTPGATTFGFTATVAQQFGWVAAEILPAAATSVDPGVPNALPGPAFSNQFLSFSRTKLPVLYDQSPAWDSHVNTQGPSWFPRKYAVLYDYTPSVPATVSASALQVTVNFPAPTISTAIASSGADAPVFVPSNTWMNWFGPFARTKRAVLFDVLTDSILAPTPLQATVNFPAVAVNTAGSEGADPIGILPGPAWQNVFGPFAYMRKQVVQYDIPPGQEGGAFASGLPFEAVVNFPAPAVFVVDASPDLATALPGPAWLNQFGPFAYLGKRSVQYDVLTDSAQPAVPLQVAASFPAVTISTAGAEGADAAVFNPSPVWMNQFGPFSHRGKKRVTHDSLTTQAALITPAPLQVAANIVTPLITAGFIPLVNSIPGPAWHNAFRGQSVKLAVVYDSPVMLIPTPFCFVTSPVDQNAYGGSATDNYVGTGGTATDNNGLLGGSAPDAHAGLGGSETDTNPYNGGGTAGYGGSVNFGCFT